MASKKKIRPPVKWHGGKFYLAKMIVEQFPEHHTYVEPFGGAASVLLNKTASPIEVYNDVDERIARLFRVLRDDGDELQRRLALTPYSESEFSECRLAPSELDEIELARRDYVCWRQSIGGRGDAFSATLHRVRRGMADVVSGYLSAIDEHLPMIVERLRRVQIVQRDAVEVIRKWDSADTLIYCDPPYVASTRSSPDVYGSEMTNEQHEELIDSLLSCKGHVVLSGYASPMYESRLKSWQTIETDIANHSASGKAKSRRREMLWINRAA